MNFPEKFIDLLKDETQAFLFLATSMADGSPQVTPIWFNTDGEYILINTAAGRVKDRNMQARPKIAATIMALSDPYRYIQIRGEVVERTTEGAVEHIDGLAVKYNRPWTRRPGQQRVIYKIKATHFDEH